MPITQPSRGEGDTEYQVEGWEDGILLMGRYVLGTACAGEVEGGLEVAMGVWEFGLDFPM